MRWSLEILRQTSLDEPKSHYSRALKMKDYTFLLLLPISVLVIFVTFFSLLHTYNSSKSFLSQTSASSFALTSTDDDGLCFCNLKTNGKSLEYCYNTSVPILGGVDMVQFFTAFKLPDGSYNESEVGQHGSELYSTTYNNYMYHFVSKGNQRFATSAFLNISPQFVDLYHTIVTTCVTPTVVMYIQESTCLPWCGLCYPIFYSSSLFPSSSSGFLKPILVRMCPR